MNNRLKAFVRYSEDGIATPHSLVRMAGRPRMKGRYLEVHRLCCDPEYTQFIGAGRNRAFVQTDKQGNPLSGPIIRGFKPKNGYWMEIAYNICCDVNQAVSLPVIIQQPLYNSGIMIVEAEGEGLTYQWQKDGVDLVDGVNYSGVSTDTLVFDLEEGSGFPGLYQVIITNSAGSVTSDSVNPFAG